MPSLHELLNDVTVLDVTPDVARKFGEVTAFAVKGEALDADQLAKCNGEKTQAVARR